MKCPICKTSEMTAVYTEQGVEVDYCPECEGIWLDRGELFYFTNKPFELQRELNDAIRQAGDSDRICPKTGRSMQEIKLLKGRLTLDYSPHSGGIWFDKNELKKLLSLHGGRFKLKVDEGTAPSRGITLPVSTALAPLPNLLVRSTMVLVFLYGILTLVLITTTLYTPLTPLAALLIGIVIVSLQFIFGPYITDLVLRWFYKMSWIKYDSLPQDLANFIRKTSTNYRMKAPRMGMINDGAPNAFTYGHTPNNARIVLTQGIIDLLNEDEIEAVVAHEIGHAKHWDMLVMTAAQLVPLVLYYLYRTMISTRKGGDSKGEGPQLAIAIGSYILYIISQYIVLWLSRTREYYADRFAGEATKSPNSLASGLVKIGYGLAGKQSRKERGKKSERKPGLEAVGALGIFDPKSGVGLVTSSISSVTAAKSMGDEIDKQTLKGAMKWDMWNPWAKYYELHSTHPLIANRIIHLSRQSESLGKAPYIRFDARRPESYWDEFFVDIFIRLLPAFAFIGFLAAALASKEMALIGAGISSAGFASLIKTNFSYRARLFPEMAISSLLKKVKVSGVRPVPCTVKGTVIGRGIPGLIWSEDFIMQDETGIIFLDYRQPIPLWDFFFGLLRRGRFDGKEVEVTGWYRRAPIPFLEMKSMKAENEKVRNCYTYFAKYIVGFILIILGFFLMGQPIM